jgi:hypothetical protein
MQESLRRYCGDRYLLHVLCLDDRAREILADLRLPGTELLSLGDLERGDPAFAATKTTRSLIEYYFTATPCLMLWLLSRGERIDALTYLDADLYFYDDPERIHSEEGNAAISVVPHRFPPRLKHLEKNGLYNVAWVTVRSAMGGLDGLSWWRERCIEWCYDRHEDGKFGDQGYLDRWPALFKGVHVIEQKGADLAPWNAEQYRLTWSEGKVLVDGDPLVFFHFQGYRQLGGGLIDPGALEYGRTCGRVEANHIYRPYIRATENARRFLADRYGSEFVTSGQTRGSNARSAEEWSLPYRIRRTLQGQVFMMVCGRPVYVHSSLVRRMFGRPVDCR